MPKLKSNRGAAKRFSKTGSGKIRFNKAYKRHILTKKSRKRKRNMRRSGILTGGSAALVRRQIPYS